MPNKFNTIYAYARLAMRGRQSSFSRKGYERGVYRVFKREVHHQFNVAGRSDAIEYDENLTGARLNLRELCTAYYEKVASPDYLGDARKYAAQNCHDLADGAFTSTAGFADHVTDERKHAYVAYNRRHAREIEEGEHDGNFTVQQRMHYFLTGDCVPFLPPEEERP